MITLAFLIISIASVQAEFSCFDGPPTGFFCTNDRNGYHDCRRDSNNEPQNIKKSCPSNTRCSCFINTKCEVAEEEICQPIQTPPELPQNFDFTFDRKRQESSPAGVTSIIEKRRVIRNTILKKLWVRIWDLTTEPTEQKFKSITTFGSRFFSYDGTYPRKDSTGNQGTCTRTNINNFPSFWLRSDLSQFQLTKTNGVVQTWEYKVGSRNAGQSSSGETYELEVIGNRVTPLSYKAIRTGSVVSKFSFTESWKVLNFYNIVLGPANFQTPGFCFNK